MINERLRPQSPSLTAEDLDLIATSRDELEERARVNSFDYDRFCDRTEKCERWQLLLQAHLYLDHVITLMLVEAFPRPAEYNAKRIGFSQKLQLLGALDLLSSDLIAPASVINELRNRVAHDLDYEIKDDVEDKLRNCTPIRLRDFIEKEPGRASGPAKLEEIIHCLLFAIEFSRQENELNRLLAKQAQLKYLSMRPEIPKLISRGRDHNVVR